MQPGFNGTHRNTRKLFNFRQFIAFRVVQKYHDAVLVAQLYESRVEPVYALEAFVIGHRAVAAGQALQALARQLALLDQVHPAPREAALLVDKQVVHHAAEPGARLVDLHEIVEHLVSLDQQLLEQVLGLGLAAREAPCEAVQPVKVWLHESLERCALLGGAHSEAECTGSRAARKEQVGSSCYSEYMNLLAELRRRRVFGTVALYIVAAWIVIQVASLLFPGLDIPDRAIRYVWLAATLGFPIAVLFAWRFQITSDGIVKTPPAVAGEGAANEPLARIDFLMLAGLATMVLLIFLRAMQDIRSIDEIVEFSAFGREIHPNSIAVLPLDNLTGDAEQAFLVDGIHEAMTSTLSRISGLRVRSRTSTASYRGSPLKLTEIAHELGVARVVTGSVLRDGGTVRVNVQLVDASTDEYLWTESYERDLRNLLALQSEVARAISKEISVELTPEESLRLRQTRQVDPEVYETYLKGMFFVKQLNPEAIMQGMQYLHETIGIDPAEPLAYAGLALGYNTIGHGVSSHDAFPKAIAAAQKALEIDELSGEAWAALAEAQLYYEWDWQKAEQTFLRAIQLSPSLDHTYAHYAYLLLLLGRSDKAIEVSEKARDLSPVDPLWAGFTAWIYLLEESRWDDAIETAEECLLFETSFDLCRYALGQVYSARGDYDRAIEIHEQIPPGDPFRNWALGISYGLAGKQDQARAVIDALSINATPRDQFHIALAYAAMGELNNAITWMNAAYESRADWLPWVVYPHAYGGAVEPLRDHPGFQAIVDQMNIPAARR